MDKKKKFINIPFSKIEVAVFLLAFLLPIFLFNQNSIEEVLGLESGDTRVMAYADGYVYDFYTSAKTINEALTGEGIKIHKNDKLSLDLNKELNGGLVEIHIKRSFPVVIKDGERLINGQATAKKEREILEENNILHWPEDVVTSELIIDPVYYSGVGRLIKIERAPVFYIRVDGRTIEIRDWKGEVGTILNKGGVVLNPNDIVSPKVDSVVTRGTEIKITRINYAEVTVDGEIPFTTIYRASTSVPIGRSRAETVGMVGSKRSTYRITYKDGKEVSRVLLSSVVTRPKRDAIIVRGAVVGRSKWGPYYETNFGPYTTSFHFPGFRGRYALVTNLANGRSVRVKIVDVGPVDALLDISTTAAREIGGMSDIMLRGFIPSVRVEIID